jgi:hypothetical protein
MKLKPETYAYNKRRAAARFKVGQQLELVGTVHRCNRCTRELKLQKSIDAGYGPRCAKWVCTNGLCGKAN